MSVDRYDWAAMRADIESGRVKSFAELSAKYGATEQAIRNRRKADEKAGNPWPLPKIARAQDQKVISLEQRRASSEKKPRGGGQSSRQSPQSLEEDSAVVGVDEPLDIEQRGDDVDPLAEQKMLGVMAQRAARRGLRRYMRNQITPGMHQSEADVLNALLSAAERAAKMNRMIAGKGNGEASDDAFDPEDAKIVIEQRTLEPKKITVNERGRAVNE